MIELKPCPFCGGEARLHVNNGVRVICNECNCQTITLVDGKWSIGVEGTAVSGVIEKWNRRVKDDVDYVNSKQPYKFEELNDLMAYHDNKLNADCLIGQVYNKYSILIGWYDDEGHNEEWVKFEEDRFYPVMKMSEE